MSLPHDIPSWVNPNEELYFITINTRPRYVNQLAKPDIAQPLFETIRFRQNQSLWWPHVFLLIPDHVHTLISFPPSKTKMRTVISKWKEWTAKQFGIQWQLDFFEHRLRHDESRREKADYILQNPVRKGFASRQEDWPFIYFADGERQSFLLNEGQQFVGRNARAASIRPGEGRAESSEY